MLPRVSTVALSRLNIREGGYERRLGDGEIDVARERRVFKHEISLQLA